jgi:hypothetical protein
MYKYEVPSYLNNGWIVEMVFFTGAPKDLIGKPSYIAVGDLYSLGGSHPTPELQRRSLER